tara:strand:- start:230 stop:526 length:297 start_codon:yes stop_codon:yes gene_type:complete
MSAKFVSFEADVKHTIKCCKDTHTSKERLDENIKGYKFISKNKMVKTSNQNWTDEDWVKFQNLTTFYKKRGQYDKLRCIIMAAWNQARSKPPPLVLVS